MDNTTRIILIMAHSALRGIDAADQTQPIPAKQLDHVSDAVAALEDYARSHGIPEMYP